MDKKPVKKFKIPKGVMFDLDGILLETEYLQWQGWVEVLKPLGKSLSKQQYYKYAGKNGIFVEEAIIKDFNLNFKEKTLLKQKEKLLIEWFNTKQINLMPYAAEAVNFFITKNIKIACATGSPKEEALLKLRKTSLFSLFEHIATGSDVKRGKPYPDVYLHAAEKLELNPADCLTFEDTEYGIAAAKSAGLTAIAIPNEYSKKQNFSDADAVFPNLKEAISLFD